MEINDWFHFVLYTSFTIGVIIVGLPIGIICTLLGLLYLVGSQSNVIPEGSRLAGYGNSLFEIIAVGLISLTLSLWYLFIRDGGALNNYVKEAAMFIGL